MGKTTNYWFKRRRYGWGWIPVTWQGWGIVAGWLVVVLGGAFTLDDTPKNEFTHELGIYLLVVLIATVGMVIISLAKGPTPRWRMGKRPDDNPDEDF
jgi:hypothetical protein